jgi:hypothetical protein
VFGVIRKIARYATALTLLLLGATGILLLTADPMPYIGKYFPLEVGGYLSIEQSLVSDWIAFTTTEMGVAIAISAMLLVTAGLLLVQDPLETLRSFKRSPLGFYYAILGGRNWLMAKVEYLQTESAKWKAFFNMLKAPYSLLRSLGFSPQMATGLLLAGSTVTGGVVVNETLLAEKSFKGGDSGIYSAPLDTPVQYVEGDNTLRIDLGTTPVREITIENVSVGTVFTGSALPSGEQNVVQVSGNPAANNFNATRLEVGTLIFENSRCKKLTLSDIQAHTIVIQGNASDGQSIAPSPGTSRMRAIGGGHHQADAMVTSGGLYDRIWIQAPSSGVNGKIGTLTLRNLYTKGGECVLSRMNVGTMKILMNEVGMGNGFATKEFVVATTVTGANITVDDNVEVTIAEPATT